MALYAIHPNKFEVGTVGHSLTKFLNAWHKRDWEKMAKTVIYLFRNNPQFAFRELKDLFGGYILVQASIEHIHLTAAQFPERWQGKTEQQEKGYHAVATMKWLLSEKGNFDTSKRFEELFDIELIREDERGNLDHEAQWYVNPATLKVNTGIPFGEMIVEPEEPVLTHPVWDVFAELKTTLADASDDSSMESQEVPEGTETSSSILSES